MVYCGKPSRACLECRIKRRKCDLSEPSCSQCFRARSTCSGYRDQVELAFRDQSKDVARRAQPSVNKSQQHISLNDSNRSDNGDTLTLKTTATYGAEKYLNCALYRGLTSSVEDQAAPFFFHHYGANDTPFSISNIDCLTTIHKPPPARGYLTDIIEAIGIASLSNLKRESGLMYAASRKYSTALRKVRAGLAEPGEVTSDQMLVGVSLFGLYETVTGNISQNIDSGTNHLKGALTLLQLRGLSQLTSLTGQHLFCLLRNEVLINCLQQNTPISQVMLKWMSGLQKFEKGDRGPFSHLANLIAKICALRAIAKSCYNTDTADSADLFLHISEALSVDTDLAKWSDNLPSLYEYSTTIMKIDEKGFYLGMYHSYSGIWIAQTWNLYRCARILLNQVLARLISLYLRRISTIPTKSSHNSLLETSFAVIRECITGILLSVPFIFGDLGKEQGASSNLRAAGGLSLMWPLYIAGTACSSQESFCEQAVSQLEKIGDIVGIRRAKMIAMMLRGKGSQEGNEGRIEISSAMS